MDFEPIGFVRSPQVRKFQTPHQPDPTDSDHTEIHLLPDRRFELALTDLAGFDRIWVIGHFHLNTTWRPRVLPPRGAAARRGVFSTRSPHRPNPISLTCTPLFKVEGLVLTVGPLDMVDGSPVLDIKPYLRTVDAYPDASLGWLEAVEAQSQQGDRFRVSFAEEAEQELEFLLSWDVDLRDHIVKTLRHDPSPHRTRRILRLGEGEFRLARGSWRVYFRVDAEDVKVLRIRPATARELIAEFAIHREEQIAFWDWLLLRGF